jgi:hypothetical protein
VNGARSLRVLYAGGVIFYGFFTGHCLYFNPDLR